MSAGTDSNRTVRDDVEFDPTSRATVVQRGGGRDVVQDIAESSGASAPGEGGGKFLVLLGLSILSLILYFGWAIHLLLYFVAFVRPAWQTLRAIEEQDSLQEAKWLSYWVLCGIGLVLNYCRSEYLPFPTLFTSVELLLVFLLSQNNARNSYLIYTELIKPNYQKRAEVFVEKTTIASNFVDRLSSRFVNGLQAGLLVVSRRIANVAAATSQSLEGTVNTSEVGQSR